MNDTDLNAALKGLLSDPEALSGIMSIANGLMSAPSLPDGAADGNVDAADTKVGNDAAEPVSDESHTANTPALPDLSAIASILGSHSGKKDPRCELLGALRPFVDNGRRERIDQLIKLLRLADMASGFLSGGKLL